MIDLLIGNRSCAQELLLAMSIWTCYCLCSATLSPLREREIAPPISLLNAVVVKFFISRAEVDLKNH